MIFISYRRADGTAFAKLVQKTLIENGFDEDEIFLDLHNILIDDFVERCRNAISECDIFLLLVTKQSFKEREEHDYYYDEINQALDENKKIIPVLYNTSFNEKTVPDSFRKKNLHRKNAIRFDIEYLNDSTTKLISALANANPASFFTRLKEWFTIPLVFITIFLAVSLVGGVIRYLWDNYWLSEKTCAQIASSHIVQNGNDEYLYVTTDSIYRYNSTTKEIEVDWNLYTKSPNGIGISINKDDIYKVGFWSTAVSLVYEVSKTKIKPRGNGKHIAVIVAATVSVAAGVGFGFVCERIIFPVQESRIITKKLHDPDWWEGIAKSVKSRNIINKKF